MGAMRGLRAGGQGWREKPGNGAVLVCLHGIGSEPGAFDALAALLPPDLRVIAWCTPGYGDTPPLDTEWPVAADYAAALGAFVDGLGLGRFHLLGHSLGTLIAAEYARCHPQRVAGLTLVSCAQGMGVEPGAPLPAPAAARLTDLAALGPVAFARARANRLVHDPQANPALVAAVQAGMAQVRLPGYAQAVRMLASGNLTDTARHVAVATVIVVGDKDVVTPPAQSKAVWQALPAASRRRFDVLPAVGHALPQQAPSALAEIVTETLDLTTGDHT
jgi:pimeloyl-ACP methyl ester carboxylesterase